MSETARNAAQVPALGETEPDGHWTLWLGRSRQNVQVYEHDGLPVLYVNDSADDSAVALFGDECEAVAVALLRHTGSPAVVLSPTEEDAHRLAEAIFAALPGLGPPEESDVQQARAVLDRLAAEQR